MGMVSSNSDLESFPARVLWTSAEERAEAPEPPMWAIYGSLE